MSPGTLYWRVYLVIVQIALVLTCMKYYAVLLTQQTKQIVYRIKYMKPNDIYNAFLCKYRCNFQATFVAGS